MKVTLTWWELEELLDTFQSYPTHFERLTPNMYLRYGSRIGPSLPWYGIALAISPVRKQYTCGTVQAQLLNGEATYNTEPDLSWLLNKFTTYAVRMRICEALVDELGTDQQTAHTMAIGLAYIALVSPEPSNETTQLVSSFGTDPETVRVLRHIGGGYTKLTLRGSGTVQASVSVNNLDTGGYGPLLRGSVRPDNGRLESISCLFELDSTVPEPVTETVQLTLPEEP